MDGLAGVYFVVAIIIFVLLVVLAIVWIVLPFIIMGTNSRLDRVIAEQQRTNALLEGRLPDLGRRSPP